MTFIDNLNILRKRFPELRNNRQIPDQLSDQSFKIEETRSGLCTLVKLENNRHIYLHSKYDPKKEAETIISSYGNIESYKHVVFCGMGLGYHIQEFARKYPDIPITIYEPVEEIFYYYLHYGDISCLPLKQIKGFYVAQEEASYELMLQKLCETIEGKNTLFITLPSYQRVFSKECEDFAQKMYQSIRNRREQLAVNERFQKLWIKNCLFNIEDTFTTPDFFSDIDKNHFAGKPALLVAAGPSLVDEIENIRKIKEHGLAYIFAASSSVSILLNHDILPDAVCTYDPNSWNYKVVEPIVKRGINTVPMIYGTSVGYKTLIGYPGPKIHALTNEDRIGYYLLNRSEQEEKLDIVMDAPTISVVVFQLLAYLGCNPIILVGQNLALKDNRYYPKGIKYYDNMKRKEPLYKVEDVEGNLVDTTQSYINMRRELENTIKQYPNIRVINTTRGGAKIAGTEFNYLENVIDTCLIHPVVNSDWCPTNIKKTYSKDIVKRLSLMDRDMEHFPDQISAMEQVLTKISSALKKGKNSSELNRLLLKFNQCFNEIMQNKAHVIFFQSMNRIEYELLINKIRQAEEETDVVKQAELVLNVAVLYFAHCKQDWLEISQVWQKKAFAIKKLLLSDLGNY